MTTATLRPNGTAVGGGATFTGGASWTAVTSDDSDASYAVMPVQATARLNLGTTTLGTDAVTKNVRVRFRARTVSGTGSVVARLKSGSTFLAPVYATNTVTTTITTFTGAYDAVSLTQSQIDSLQLEVYTYSESCRIVELYVDLVSAEVPTCVVVTPTGTTTNTATPEISWTHTAGSAGGAQTHYNAKIFTAAQYGAGGFNPDASTSTWESGQVVTAASSANVGTTLPDDTTYRAYVKTGQTINSAVHWSAWDFEGFDINLSSPPEVSTVVPSDTAATGSITVTVTRDGGSTLWTYCTVERQVDSGDWEFVRGASQAAATGSTFVITDYEVPNGSTVLYRAQAITDAGGTLGILAGDWVQASGTDSWTSTTAVWLKAPGDSTVNNTVSVLDRPEVSRPRRQGVFNVLNRAAPVVVSDVQGSRTGSFTIYTASSAAAVQVANLLDIDALLLQFPAAHDFDDLYFAVGEASERYMSPKPNTLTRHWVVNFVEVDRPPDTSS